MKRFVGAVFLCLLAPGVWRATGQALPGELFGQFASVPHRRQLRVTPLVTYSSSDRYYDGAGTPAPFPAVPDLTQTDGALLVEYGFASYVAGDLTLSGVSANGPNAAGDGSASTAGLGDTQFGVRWRLLDEDLKESEPFVPTLTLRAGGIIRGTYDASLPFAPGVGASGADLRVMMTDTLGASPVSLYGDFGWRWYLGGTPNHLFGSAGAGFSLRFAGAIRDVTLNIGYAFDRATSGSEISGPTASDWAGANWGGLESLARQLQVGFTLRDNRDRRYQAFVVAVLAGENVPDAMTVGVSVQIPFKRFPRRER